MDVPNWVMQRAQLSSNKVAIEIGNEHITFGQLHQRALVRCGYFQKIGVKRGDVVAILSENSINSIECIFGIMYCGAVSLLLNTRLTEHEWQWQVADSKTKFVFSDRSVSFSHFLIEKIEDEKEGNYQATFSLQAPCTMMYTSGTTGRPKCVVHTYGNHYHSAIASLLNVGLHEDDCWLSSLPFFHVGGFSMLIKSVLYGMRIISVPAYNPAQLCEVIENRRVTMMSVVTKMVHDMVESENGRLALQKLRFVLVGGGPISSQLVERCLEEGIPLYQTYGMTETASQIVTLSPHDLHRKQGSVGKPLFGCELRIKKYGQDCNPYEEGEIVVRGANVFHGYLHGSEGSFIDGWFYTGDIGYVDDEGFLYICDRRKDLIISGGENIYPIEIERVIEEIDGVKDVGVIGIPSTKWGQRPIAIVQIEASITKEEIFDYCRQRLARYKVPDELIFVKDNLPRNAMNKLMRHQLMRYIHENH
ncbi:MAG: o-succinylbenzoate--CoA ligase [Bacillaceae bacterium]